MSTPHAPERREQGLRRSGAAGVHDGRPTRAEAVRAALADQVESWSCPRCCTLDPPRETPAGTYCSWCRIKLETCCEGAPLPPRPTTRGTPTMATIPDHPRPAEPGELCTCGRQASVIYPTKVGPLGEVGHCGADNGGAPANGWCPFCENELTHDEPQVDAAGKRIGTFRQGAKCPRYRLRLTDPVP